jgi:bacterioferritin-associated ferredoxin
MYACICRAISEADVRRAGASGVTTPEALIAAFRLDGPRCCGRCRQEISRFASLAREGAAEALTVLPLAARAAGAGAHGAWQHAPA